MQSSPTTRCPACGGEVHAIAGRCKHCKHDLVAFRAQRALAAHPAPHAPYPPRPGPQLQPQQPQTQPQPQPQPAASRGVNGTPPAGLAPAQRAPVRVQPMPAAAPYPVAAPLRRRWPIWVGGAALFLLGLSAGVMIERWRGPAPAEAAADTTSSQGNSPMLVPDHIPTDPMLPRDPTAPVPDPGAGGPAGDVTAFIERFGSLFCDKAIECGLFEDSNRSLCESAVAQSRDPAASSKLASGDCTYNAAAAARCLSSIQGASCDPSVGADQMATLLASSMLECERAYSCR